MRPRVLIADDHKLLLAAFQKLLEPACDVVGTVLDGRALLNAAERLKPDVVVMDISMPRLNGLVAGEQLKQMMPEVKLIYLTVNEDPDLVAEALHVGASGYLLKASASSELFTAIQEVMRGGTYVTPLVTVGAVERDRETGSQKLTTRQREVLQLLAEGHSMKEAASLLDVTPRTVAFHKYRIMEELGIENNAELFQFAIKNGLVSL